MAKVRYGAVSLKGPKGWNDLTEVILVAPIQDGFRPNLSIVREALEKKEDAAGYAARQLPRLSAALPEFKSEREGGASYGSLKGYSREHSFALESQRYAQLHFYVAFEGTAYTFSLTHLASHAAELPKLASEILATVELKND